MLCTKKRYGVLQEAPNKKKVSEYDQEIPQSQTADNPVTAENPCCSDRNIAYALICCKCDKTVYVGETERTLKERTDEHLRDVRQQAEKPIMRHFEGHKEEQLRVTILQRMFQEGRIYRQLAEEQWTIKLKTKIPQGCNFKLN